MEQDSNEIPEFPTPMTPRTAEEANPSPRVDVHHLALAPKPLGHEGPYDPPYIDVALRIHNPNLATLGQTLQDGVFAQLELEKATRSEELDYLDRVSTAALIEAPSDGPSEAEETSA